MTDTVYDSSVSGPLFKKRINESLISMEILLTAEEYKDLAIVLDQSKSVAFKMIACGINDCTFFKDPK